MEPPRQRNTVYGNAPAAQRERSYRRELDVQENAPALQPACAG